VSADFLANQRGLVGLNVRLEDATWYAKYAFPFFDLAWKVRFLLFDVLGDVPRFWEARAVLAGRELRIQAKTADVPRFGSMAAERLKGLLHFDPWWDLKGGLPIPPELRAAAIATNVASKYHPLDVPRRVRDIVFDSQFDRVVAVSTEDEYFREKSYQEGELDLRKLLPISA
jgi:hypothetical protein